MPVSMGEHPRHLEELRLGGGFDYSPGGGADFDSSGNIQSNGDLEMDGAATIGGNLDVSGDVDVTGNVDVGGDLHVDGLDTNWRVYLPATLGLPDPSLPCGAPTAINWRNYQVVTAGLEYGFDTPKAAFFQFRLPPNYDDRPLKFALEWATKDGTSGSVRWGVLPIAFVDGSSLINVGSTNYQTDSVIGMEILHVCTIEALVTTPDENALTTVRVVRLSNDGSDTLDESVHLIGLEVSF